jgi:hypothetical protein
MEFNFVSAVVSAIKQNGHITSRGIHPDSVQLLLSRSGQIVCPCGLGFGSVSFQLIEITAPASRKKKRKQTHWKNNFFD